MGFMKQKTCAEAAKDLVNTYGNISIYGPNGVFNFYRLFKDCSDFPREPLVVKCEIDFTRLGIQVSNAASLNGKKWKAVATEIIE
jgi:hypothetical protein